MKQLRGIPGMAIGLAMAVAATTLAAAETGITVAGLTEPILDVKLAASVAGIVAVRNFKEGDTVKKGEVIVELNKKLEELEVTRRELETNRLYIDYRGTETLFKKTSSVSQEDLQKKELEYRVAVLQHDLALEQLRRRMVTAPFDGYIVELPLQVGEAAQEQQPLVRLVDTHECYFVSNVEAKIGHRLAVNQEVKLEVEVGAKLVPVTGKVYFVSPVVDAASGLMKVKVIFENPAGKIRPGVAGKLILPESNDAN